MNKGSIEAAKKFFGKHFKNQFKKIDSWGELPKAFKKMVFGYGDGERMFEKYNRDGQFYAVITPESRYLVHISSKRDGQIQIVDEGDRIKKPSHVEFELNLPILGLTLQELLEGIFEEKEEEEFSDLTESDINRIVKKTIKEQETNEGPLDAIGDFYRGVKGVKRGYGMDYFQNMSRLDRLIKRLKKLDEPNIKVMKELSTLKSKVSSLNMPQQRKQALVALIENSLFHFNKYNQINDQIISQIGTLNLDSWK